MTADSPAPDNQPSGIRASVFFAVAALVVIAAFAAIWFAIPGPDTSHRITSPSGTRTIELAELCTDLGCRRVAVLDVTQGDGTHLRTGCPVPVDATVPLFGTITTIWTQAEDALDIDYAAASGPAGTLTLRLADCTLTELG